MSYAWVLRSILEKLERCFQILFVVSWCKDKKEAWPWVEGTFFHFHQALASKQVVRTITDPTSIWVRLVHEKYSARRDIDSFVQKLGCSFEQAQRKL